MSQISGPNFGGAVSGNKAGELFVGIAADLQPLRRGLKQAEAEVKAADARMKGAAVVPVGSKSTAFGAASRATIGAGGVGMGPGAGVSTIGAAAAATDQVRDAAVSLDHADRKARGLFTTLTSVRRLISRLFIPALIVTQITRMTKAFDDLVHSAEEYQKALRDTASGPATELLKTLREVRVAQGNLTASQVEEMEIRERGVAVELALNEQYQARLIHLNSISGIMEGLATGRTGIQMMAENERKYNEQLAITRGNTEQLIKLNAQLRDELEQVERIQKRIREQAKRDITHTVIDAKRLGPALDLLQRQRTTN